MNKPATKEPSMDEILSSIRQIIADDDASAVPPAPPPTRPAIAAAPAPAPRPIIPPSPPAEPLALSAAQIVTKPAPAPIRQAPPRPAAEPEPAPDFSAMLAGFKDEPDFSDPLADMPLGEPELIDPEDVAFEAEMELEVEPEPEPQRMPPPVIRAPQPAPQSRPAPRPMAVAQAAPMPDQSLSSDIAEQLLEPTTGAAIQGTMSRLAAVSAMGSGQTIEGLMRDMMRPMLKEWLDENLPALVERVVEKEIARISRGVK